MPVLKLVLALRSPFSMTIDHNLGRPELTCLYAIVAIENPLLATDPT